MPADSLRPPQVLLVYAQYEKQAKPGAVPVAVQCLRPGEATTRLALLPGTYVAELRDAHLLVDAAAGGGRAAGRTRPGWRSAGPTTGTRRRR